MQVRWRINLAFLAGPCPARPWFEAEWFQVVDSQTNGAFVHPQIPGPSHQGAAGHAVSSNKVSATLASSGPVHGPLRAAPPSQGRLDDFVRRIRVAKTRLVIRLLLPPAREERRERMAQGASVSRPGGLEIGIGGARLDLDLRAIKKLEIRNPGWFPGPARGRVRAGSAGLRSRSGVFAGHRGEPRRPGWCHLLGGL